MPMAGSRQLVEKPPRLFQIDSVKALCEPAVYGRQEISGCCTPALFAPQPGEARRGAQLIGLGVLLPRDAQRLFEGDLALFEPVETDERNAFETMKFRSPPQGSRFRLHLRPLPRRSDNRAVLTLAYQGLGQLGESVRPKRYRAQPAGKRIAQARDRLIERAVRAQRGAAQEPRFHHKPEPLLGDKRLC